MKLHDKHNFAARPDEEGLTGFEPVRVHFGNCEHNQVFFCGVKGVDFGRIQVELNGTELGFLDNTTLDPKGNGALDIPEESLRSYSAETGGGKEVCFNVLILTPIGGVTEDEGVVQIVGDECSFQGIYLINKGEQCPF